MQDDAASLARPFTRAGIARGVRDLSGATVPVFAFGLGFGAAASNAGLSPAQALAMSGLVFAGASQYAALGLWADPLPLLTLVLLTLAVNARHLVLGATLHGYLAGRPAAARYAALAVLSDANWASTQQAVSRGEDDLGHLVGGGLVLWLIWILGTALGSAAGGSLGDLRRFGIDAVMPAFFACVLIGMTRDRRDVPPWIVAGLAAAAAAAVIPVHWAVLAGAFAGATAGVAFDARR